LYLYYDVKFNGYLINQKEKYVKKGYLEILEKIISKKIKQFRISLFNKNEIDIIDKTLEINKFIIISE
jgi:hypothetical protein